MIDVSSIKRMTHVGMVILWNEKVVYPQQHTDPSLEIVRDYAGGRRATIVAKKQRSPEVLG
ncbi:hypothetical protein LCGC14_0918740 [marine sediment metagenome]|uniref:Uncharacterized protein n=1 Tax=marine sediment metagenome TaxID=412755 RepID=A0A0F9PC55_9ZZZZ